MYLKSTSKHVDRAKVGPISSYFFYLKIMSRMVNGNGLVGTEGQLVGQFCWEPKVNWSKFSGPEVIGPHLDVTIKCGTQYYKCEK